MILVKMSTYVIFIIDWFLGGYDMEKKAASAYDLVALKYWGPATHISFLVSFRCFLKYVNYVILPSEI